MPPHSFPVTINYERYNGETGTFVLPYTWTPERFGTRHEMILDYPSTIEALPQQDWDDIMEPIWYGMAEGQDYATQFDDRDVDEEGPYDAEHWPDPRIRNPIVKFGYKANRVAAERAKESAWQALYDEHPGMDWQDEVGH
jgi:hypothetical protein